MKEDGTERERKVERVRQSERERKRGSESESERERVRKRVCERGKNEKLMSWIMSVIMA